MHRDASLAAAADRATRWDVLIIGGGATGLGAAVDAAARGYRTLLLEQHDFAKATSSRSTKLVHGGVRYLRQGNISLVRESLHERARLLRNAPGLTRLQRFLVPAYGVFDRSFYGVGLKLYDALAGRFSLGTSEIVSREEALRELPTLQPQGLRGGVSYFDGQFDDARLAVALAQKLHVLGGWAVNYVRVVQLLKEAGRTVGVTVRDEMGGAEWEIRARVVVNATGAFSDAIRQFDEPGGRARVAVSQGTHLVLDRRFLPGTTALMVPKTADGRVLFAIPWHGRVLVGTTDTPVDEPRLEPRPLAGEVEFLLTEAGRYLAETPRPSDVVSVFAGLRPLVNSADGRNTAKLARDHAIVVSESGLVSITGGKWTTYRHMGEDVVNVAASVGGLATRNCDTRDLSLPGSAEQPALDDITSDIVRRQVREEMATSLEDVLARRTRHLILDPRATLEAAPRVAALLARELDRDPIWEHNQRLAFRALASGYLWPPTDNAPDMLPEQH